MVEDAQKQLTMLKTKLVLNLCVYLQAVLQTCPHFSCRHHLKEYSVRVAREGWDDQEEEEVQEEATAVVDLGQQLESSPPPLQLPTSESQESIESSQSLQKGSRTSLPQEASPPSRTSSNSSLHEKPQIPSEKSSRVSSAVSLTKVDEGTPDKKQVGKEEQDGWPHASVELPRVYMEKEKMMTTKAPEEQALGRKAEVRLEYRE